MIPIDKKMHIGFIIGLAIFGIALYVYCGEPSSNGRRTDGVTTELNTARQQLADTTAELQQAGNTVRDLQETNKRLTEEIAGLRETNEQLNGTISDLTKANSEFERIINESESENNAGRDNIKRMREIISTIQAREPR
jgi:chromosome segregation ATPase